MNSKNIVRSVGISSDRIAINYNEMNNVSVNSAGNIPPPKSPSVNLNVLLMNEYSYVVQNPTKYS